MPRAATDSLSVQLKKGTLAMLVLQLLREKDMYGYQIAVVLDERSDGLLYVADNSLYGVLYRLSSNGYISSKKENTGGRAFTTTWSQRAKRIWNTLYVSIPP